MRQARIQAGWLGLAVGIFWAGAGMTLAQPLPFEQGRWWVEDREAKPVEERGRGKDRGSRATTSAPIPAALPLDELPAAARRVISQPTLSCRGPVEEFVGSPAMYRWLLDHPDRAARAWRRLGAQCMDIVDAGGGVYRWTDGQGKEVRWWTIHDDPTRRIWYAEGSARHGLLPTVPFRAVVVLKHGEGPEANGRARITQQADLYLQTDSKAAALIARLLGASAPQLAEQGLAQLEMFFSRLVIYTDRHPDWVEPLLSDNRPNPGPQGPSSVLVAPAQSSRP